jgi:outer membrane protein assembly factor BamB
MMAGGPAAARSRAPAAAGWPQFQGNAGHTGAEMGETSVTRANVGQLSVAWTKRLPGMSLNSEVVVSGGAAYAGAGSAVSAFSASSGTRLWQASLPGGLLGTPSAQGGLVLVAISEGSFPHLKGFVVALNGATGATAWMRSVGSLDTPSLGSSTTITTTADRAYVTLASGQVEAMGLEHGSKIWVSAAVGSCPASQSQPSVAGGLVVVGTGGSGVVALHTSDGTVAWDDTLGTGCGFSAANWLPAISQGTVYAGLLTGVAALSLASGAVVWQNQSPIFSQGVFRPLALTGTTVIAPSQGGSQLAALNRSDGTLRWQTAEPNSKQVASAAIFGGLVWALAQPGGGGGGARAKAVAFGTLTGHRLFTSAAFHDDTQGFPPTVSAGHVYLNTSSEVVALALPGAR